MNGLIGNLMISVAVHSVEQAPRVVGESAVGPPKLNITIVSPQAHGIHPPKPLIFFSRKLRRWIEEVWRRGPFSRVKKKKEEKAWKGRKGKGEEKAVEVSERYLGQQRRQEDYEPTELIYKWWLVNDRRKWERMEEYFGAMSEYERAGESGCNAKYGAENLREI